MAFDDLFNEQAGAPFGIVDQFVSLREGLSTSPLSPHNRQPRAPQIRPNYGAIPQRSQPTQGNVGGEAPQPIVIPTESGQGVASQFSALEQAFPQLRMTSGYRDPEHNARVGGVKNSWHTKKDEHGHERARDYVGSASDMQNAAAAARAAGAREVLIHNAGSGVHLHVAF